MMSTNYSTALSHIVLAGTSICCYFSVDPTTYARCSFASIMINSMLGVWRWGNPSYGPNTDQAYKLTTLIQDLIVLPFIVSSLWIQYGYMQEIALGNMIIPVIPIVTYILKGEHLGSEFKDTINTVNCGVLFFISIAHDNYFGLAACLSYVANLWIKNPGEELFFGLPSTLYSFMPDIYSFMPNIPTQDLYNYAMCFFSCFALRALMD